MSTVVWAWGVAIVALVAAWATVRYAGPLTEGAVYVLLWAASSAAPVAVTLVWACGASRRDS